MVQQMVSAAKPKMDAAIAHFGDELKTVRTGRANAAMLDGVMVSAYGSMMPLKQVATVTSPEPQQLMVQPFDAGLLNDIRVGIVQADMGFNPSDDGRTLRIVIPPLTAERREELVKKVGKMAEQTRITLRNIRAEVWEHVQKAQKDGQISEDNRDWGRDEIDKVTGEYNKKVEALVKEKEVEITTV
ncbi:MAG TPA: ribosome recycling factor [Verrucomicrobiae bacterium]|nr:ribosome recycling factor [Verrucomicrobiae bacterium]